MAAKKTGKTLAADRAALRDDSFLDLLAQKVRKAGQQPNVRCLPRRSDFRLIWLVCHFPATMPPLTFRSLVNLVTEEVQETEDPYLPIEEF